MSAHFTKTVLADANAVGQAAAVNITSLLKKCVEGFGKFSIALAGGSTPKQAYGLMASEPLVSTIPWEKVHIFFGDERHVPPSSPDSNLNMASGAMLSKAPIPKANVFPIPTGGELEADAAAFEALLKAQFPKAKDFPTFDLVLLGIGPDGHTASLFPGTPAPKVRDRWVTTCDPNSANPAIKPAVKRITVTAPVIWNATNVFVLATGAEKTPQLAKIFCEEEPADAPVSRLLRQCKGQVTFFMDQAAAAKL